MMNVKSARNPQWADDENTGIDLLVTFTEIGEVAFTAHPGDSEKHGRELFERAVAGEFGSVVAHSSNK